jgi:hypothetical protein
MSLVDELTNLDVKRKSGILSQEECDAEKAKLLAGVFPPANGDGEPRGEGSFQTSDRIWVDNVASVASSTCANGHPMNAEHAFCPACGADRADHAIESCVASPAVAHEPSSATDPTTTVGSPLVNPVMKMSPERKTQQIRLAVGVVAVIVLAVILGVVLLNKSNGPASPASGIPGSGGLTIAQLQSTAMNQITGPAPSGFAATGVSSVICNPPSTWAPGKTFTCYAYASSGTEVGEYLGTVEPNDSSGEQQWNAQWLPNGG